MKPNFEILRRNHVQVRGNQGPPVLCVHGFGCDQEIWRLLWPNLAQTHQVILFDYTGFGKSRFEAFRSSDFQSLEDFASLLLEILDVLEFSKADIVAHSASGIISGLAYLQSPERIRKIAMICPSPCYLNKVPNYHGGFEEQDLQGLLQLMEANDFQWAATLSELVVPTSESREIQEEFKVKFCAANPEAAINWARLVFLSDYRSILPKILCPTLIFHCDNDPLVPNEVAHYMQANLPKSTLEILPVAGHSPQLTHPELILPTLSKFLDSRD